MQCIVDLLSDCSGLKAIPAMFKLKASKSDVLLNVPSYSQTDSYSCGAIAAWSILEMFRPRVNFEKFYDTVGPVPVDGSSPRQVVSALRKFKINTRTKRNMGWDEIKARIDAGLPMLVGTGREEPDSGGDHWSLLYGYGVRGRKVYLGNQPGIIRNQVRLGWKEFLNEWWNPRGIAIVCWRMKA